VHLFRVSEDVTASSLPVFINTYVFDKYTSTNKNAADRTMTGKVFARFANDRGYNRGDWGNADDTHTPGLTYDEEMRSNSINELEKPASHAEHPYHSVLRAHGFNHEHSGLSSNGTWHFYTHPQHGHVTTRHEGGRNSFALYKPAINKNTFAHSPADADKMLKDNKSVQEQKNPDHQQIKNLLKEHGFVRNKGGVYVNESGFQVKYQLADGSFQINGQNGMKAATLRSHLDEVQKKTMKKERIVETAPANLKLLSGVLKEAAAFEKLDTTHCDICGKKHPESCHVSAPGAFAAEGDAEDFQAGQDNLVGMTERVGLKHNPINQKGSVWTRIKKKLQIEDEDPSPDELQKAGLCSKTDGKEVLDELGEAERTGSFKKAYDRGFTRQQELHRLHGNEATAAPEFHHHLMQIGPKDAKQYEHMKSHFLQGVSAASTLGEAKKFKKKYDMNAAVKAMARERVGQPKGRSVIVPKKNKPEKYKPNFNLDY
jgi:hypothetical protein